LTVSSWLSRRSGHGGSGHHGHADRAASILTHGDILVLIFFIFSSGTRNFGARFTVSGVSIQRYCKRFIIKNSEPSYCTGKHNVAAFLSLRRVKTYSCLQCTTSSWLWPRDAKQTSRYFSACLEEARRVARHTWSRGNLVATYRRQQSGATRLILPITTVE
jgi:hypothetical protein